MDEELWTATEVGAFLKLDAERVLRNRKRWGIPVLKPAGAHTIRFLKSDVIAWAKAQSVVEEHSYHAKRATTPAKRKPGRKQSA